MALEFGRENQHKRSGTTEALPTAPPARWTARRIRSRLAPARGQSKADLTAPARHPQLLDDALSQSAGASAHVRANTEARPETSSMYETPILKRAAYLTADAIILTLASPVFAVWWSVRTVRRWLSKA